MSATFKFTLQCLCILRMLYDNHARSVITVFVAQNGTDYPLCGTVSNPCGTFWMASKRSDESLSTNSTSIDIQMIDGQNETEIEYYHQQNDNDSHPCLPVTFASTLDVTITFNAGHINDFRDWYPSICDSNVSYINEYMFDGGKSLTINHLIVSNYSITGDTNTYLLIRSSYFNASLTCNHCTFKNITSVHNQSLILSNASVYLRDAQFIGISAADQSIIYADHRRDLDEATRHIVLTGTYFGYIHSEFIIESTMSFNDQAPWTPLLLIDGCQFNQIAVGTAIIKDKTRQSDVYIKNTNFNILSGLIFITEHDLPSDVSIENASITSNQVDYTRELWENGLFYFENSVSSNFAHVQFTYLYNLSNSCKYFSEIPSNTSWIDTTFVLYACKVPIKAIRNFGHCIMNDITLDMEINDNGFYHDEGKLTRYHYEHQLGSDSLEARGLILNQGIMAITKMNVIKSVGDQLIWNENQLSISYLTFDSTHYIDFNPNSLQSWVIILTASDESTLYVDHSTLHGSRYPIYASGAQKVEILNSQIEHSSGSTLAYVKQIIINNCTLKNVGKYSGPIVRDWYYKTYYHTVLLIYSSETIIITNNRISGFDSWGLVLIEESNNTFIADNEFNINATDELYSLPSNPFGFIYPYGVVTLSKNSNSKLIRNQFTSSANQYHYFYRDPHYVVDEVYIGNFSFAQVPSIRYYDHQNTGIHCLSGNTFIDFAILATDTTITSCYRPDLIECAQNTFAECFSDIYGYRNNDASLMNETGNFIVASDNTMVMYTERGTIVLDNVNITTQPQLETPSAIFVAHSGDILLVDSYIEASNDILYNTKHSDLISNHRLLSDSQYVSHLLLRGHDNYSSATIDEFELQSTMNYIQEVPYLSPIKMEVATDTDTYFPGQFVKLEYLVYDKMDHEIAYKSSNSTKLLIDDKEFAIEANGDCDLCETGMVLHGITIKNDINANIQLGVSVVDDSLHIINQQLSLRIVGCPIAYGRDKHNLTCHVCSNGYYNVLNSNLNECRLCDTETNEGLDCEDGQIYLSRNHWMVLNSASGDVLSSICANAHCCRNHTGKCNYIEDDKSLLCAENRDYESTLCAKCNEGYSESINSNQCIKCEQSFYVLLLFYPITLSILIALLNTATSTTAINPDERKTNPKEVGLKQLLSGEYCKVMMTTLIWKNIMYYQQAISQTLSASTVPILVSSVAQLFNLNSVFNSSSNAPLCFMDGLNAKQKVLFNLIVPITVMILITLLYFISVIKYDGVLVIKRRKVNFGKLFLSSFLVIIGNILSVLFQLLNCHSIGEKTVHFYFAYEECYGLTWILSLLSLVVIYIAFSFIFIKLWKMDQTQRHESIELTDIVQKYKPQCYYWEYVLFTRRVTIALFAVSVTGIVSKMGLIATLLVFVFVQHKYEPFITNEANEMEIVLLCCLIFIIATQSLLLSYASYANVIISFLIIFPFVLVAYYLHRLVKKRIFKTRDEMVSAIGELGQPQLPQESEPVNTENMEPVTEGEHEAYGDDEDIDTIAIRMPEIDADAAENRNEDSFVEETSSSESLTID